AERLEDVGRRLRLALGERRPVQRAAAAEKIAVAHIDGYRNDNRRYASSARHGSARERDDDPREAREQQRRDDAATQREQQHRRAREHAPLPVLGDRARERDRRPEDRADRRRARAVEEAARGAAAPQRVEVPA